MIEPAPPWIVVAGPTGSGKSELAVSLAETVGGEIVNFDSVQVYRGFDIGSAKPAPALRARVPHHLFEFVDPETEFQAADFADRARAVCAEIESRGRRPVLVGGTGFYLRALLAGLPDMPPRDEGVRSRLRRLLSNERGRTLLHRWLVRVDPRSAERISPADRHRLERALEVWIVSGRPISSYQAPTAPTRPACRIGLRVPREELVRRLDERVERMYAEGLVEETRRLLGTYRPDARPFTAIGYAEASKVAQGTLARDEAIAETKRRTRAYAKRQMTWFRAEREMHWVDATRSHASIVEESLEVIRRLCRPDSL